MAAQWDLNSSWKLNICLLNSKRKLWKVIQLNIMFPKLFCTNNDGGCNSCLFVVALLEQVGIPLETPNRYDIMNTAGNRIYFAAETGGLLSMQVGLQTALQMYEIIFSCNAVSISVCGFRSNSKLFDLCE